MFIKDFSTSAYDPYHHEGINPVSIGWLGNTVPSTGSVPCEFIDLPNHLYQRHSLSELELGYHDCEICDDYFSCGQLWLEVDGTRCIMPMMILHYIREHRYCPPRAFVDLAVAFWHSQAADQCRSNTCDVRPIDFCESPASWDHTQYPDP